MSARVGMDISEINDEKTARAWLERRSQKDVVVVSVRAALRVLPLYWVWSQSDYARQRKVTALPVLRCALLSREVSLAPSEESRRRIAAKAPAIINVAQAAAALVSDVSVAKAAATTGAKVAATDDFALAAASASACVTAFEAAVAGFPDAAATRTFSAADKATSSAASHGSFWRAVQSDFADLEAGHDILVEPLWGRQTSLGEPWRKVQAALLSSVENAKTWQFWRDWYNAMLDPAQFPPDWELYEQVALIEDDIWDAGPEAVAEEIERLQHDDDGKGWRAEKRLLRHRAEFSSLSDQAQELRSSVVTLSGEMRSLSERFPQFVADADTVNERLSQIDTRIAEIEERFTKVVTQQIGKVETRFAALQDEYEGKFAASLAAFNAENTIKAPVELWKEKEWEHEERRDQAFMGFVLGLLVTALSIGWVVYLLLDPGDRLVQALSPIGCEPSEHPDLCAGFSFRGMVLSGAVLTLLTLALWFTRLQMKQFLSERHLALDARERQAFAQTYIGFLKEGDTVGKEAKDQRAMVYAALFRPSADGIIKDEGGLDPSLVAALSKFLMGK